jgi:hypothetical protein
MKTAVRKPVFLHHSNNATLVAASDLRVAPAVLLANRAAVVEYTTIQNMVVAYGATPAPPTRSNLEQRLRQATATATESAELHKSLRHAEFTVERYLPQRLRRATAIAIATPTRDFSVVVNLSMPQQRSADRWDRIIGLVAGIGAVAGLVGTVLLKQLG